MSAADGRSSHWLTGLLLLAVVGLGTSIFFELAGDLALAPEVTAAAPEVPALAPPPEPREYRPPAQREFGAIAARPLFFPSRRPFVAATEAAADTAAVEEPAVALELIGVLLTERLRTALVQAADQPGARWVRENEQVGGWLVEAIAADHVQLREGDRVELIELRADQIRQPPRPKRKRVRERGAEPEEPEDAAEATTPAPDAEAESATR